MTRSVNIKGHRYPAYASAPSSPVQGDSYVNTTTNVLYTYIDGTWRRSAGAIAGDSINNPGLFAKDIKTAGNTENGFYYMTLGGTVTSYSNYCLMNSTYDGGGWTLLGGLSDGNGFASGSNYFFSLNVNSTSPSISVDYMRDLRNTFTPSANDQFMIRREDNNDWVRFVVSNWSPTANNVANGWETTRDTTGTERNHPYWALGQMYNASGSAVSGVTHFNGCALGGNCNSGGGDGAAFGTYANWSYAVSGARAWGGAFNGATNGGSPLFWDTANINGTHLTYWYRPA